MKPRCSAKLVGAAATLALLFSGAANSATTTFFDPANLLPGVKVGSTDASDTISSSGYLFTYSLDKLFTGGVGMTIPIGRAQSVEWPYGIHAQAVTTPGPVGPAQISITRSDGNVFDLESLTFKILGNTYATGANLEVTPILNGNDGSQTFLDATGIGGFSTFTYAPHLTGYDQYTLSLFTDYQLNRITLVDASPAVPVPEPETYAMMLAGLGLLGFMARRRKQFSD